MSNIIYDAIVWYISIFLPFISKYLNSASVFALTISNSFVTFSVILYLLIFFSAISFSYSTDIKKSIYPFDSGNIFIVFFKATIPSVVSPIFFDNGIEFLIASGISKLFLPINFSLLISYSVSPIFSISVCNFAIKYKFCSFFPLFLLLTTIVSFTSSYSYSKNKLLKAWCA